VAKALPTRARPSCFIRVRLSIGKHLEETGVKDCGSRKEVKPVHMRVIIEVPRLEELNIFFETPPPSGVILTRPKVELSNEPLLGPEVQEVAKAAWAVFVDFSEKVLAPVLAGWNLNKMASQKPRPSDTITLDGEAVPLEKRAIVRYIQKQRHCLDSKICCLSGDRAGLRAHAVG
jgi:hypothetical protein